MMGAAEAIFRETDFIPYVPPPNLGLGASDPDVHLWLKGMGVGAQSSIEQAWDTALGQPQSESFTVSLTGLLVPCDEWHCGEDEILSGRAIFITTYICSMPWSKAWISGTGDGVAFAISDVGATHGAG